MEAAVASTIDLLRSAIESDGGAIELRSVDSASGVVRVALSGSCSGCPTSSGTLLAGIARIVRDHVPEVTRLVNVAEVSEASETSVDI